MSKLLKKMKTDLKKSMKREINFRRDNIATGAMFEATISVKNVVRTIISMFPEIGVKPDQSTDEDVIKLLKKYISSEKIRELYLQHILSGTTVTGLSSKELNKLQKEKLELLGDKLTSMKISIAESYLPPEVTVEEITEWIGDNIDFNDYKNKMQAMGPIMKNFKGADGNKVKRILLNL